MVNALAAGHDALRPEKFSVAELSWRFSLMKALRGRVRGWVY